MGTFFAGCEIMNIGQRNRSFTVPQMLVDTGSEYTWAPRIGVMLANGQPLFPIYLQALVPGFNRKSGRLIQCRFAADGTPEVSLGPLTPFGSTV
jgi:hypothetical protein